MKKRTILIVLSTAIILLAVVLVPFSETTYVHGMAEIYNDKGTMLGQCPISLKITDYDSIIFHYDSSLSGTIDGEKFPDESHDGSDAKLRVVSDDTKSWSQTYYDSLRDTYILTIVLYRNMDAHNFTVYRSIDEETLEYRIVIP